MPRRERKLRNTPELDPKLTVATGYDRIVEEYLRERGAKLKENERRYLDLLTEGLDEDASVLDLGCGSGAPVAAFLSRRFDFVGVDISRRQLGHARQLVPAATFVLADMTSLAFQPASFDAIVALYSIIHVPREEHAPLIHRLFDWLRPGRRLLAVMGSQSWEGRESDWFAPGAEMYWSHFGADTNLDMLGSAGFRVLDGSIEPDSHDGAHLFVLAEKPA